MRSIQDLEEKDIEESYCTRFYLTDTGDANEVLKCKDCSNECFENRGILIKVDVKDGYDLGILQCTKGHRRRYLTPKNWAMIYLY